MKLATHALSAIFISLFTFSAAHAAESKLVLAALAEIQESQAAGNTDTQCSDFVGKVLRRLGVSVSGFHANDFDQMMPKILPNWRLSEFTIEATGRADLRAYLNSLPDQTALLAQWPRTGQSGHVAIVEKVADDQYVIYQAQAGLSLPSQKPVKIEGLLYGALPVARSHVRLWSE